MDGRQYTAEGEFFGISSQTKQAGTECLNCKIDLQLNRRNHFHKITMESKYQGRMVFNLYFSIKYTQTHTHTRSTQKRKLFSEYTYIYIVYWIVDFIFLHNFFKTGWLRLYFICLNHFVCLCCFLLHCF